MASILVLGMSACSATPFAEADFVVTIPPLGLILQEIVGEEAEIACILPPGASPHTFELRPSTARVLERAKAVFYVHDSIDGWAARLAPGRLHPVFAMLPEELQHDYDGGTHNHADDTGTVVTHHTNAHFWSDPVAVRAIVPELVKVLSQIDSTHADRYAANAETFLAQLDALDREFQALPKPIEGYALVAFHPSWNYYCVRYGIAIAAYVEPFPGKEPTPQTIQALVKELASARSRVVLSEVQLPAKSAEILAESLHGSVVTIDPLGGQADRSTYAQLLRFNANRIHKALQ